MQDQAKILFLDDMGWRHSTFTRVTDRLPNVRVWQAHHAAGAITLLGGERFDQVFLDHDLCEEDIMCAPGGGRVPTGMAVVDHILTMAEPPMDVIVHSCNEPAALAMVAKLESHPAGIRVRRIPFPHLIQLMEQSLGQDAR